VTVEISHPQTNSTRRGCRKGSLYIVAVGRMSLVVLYQHG
jgi:hypothetical protein